MAELRLPFSAGAESSSVSFDPRRQVALSSDDETTQVTQSGGRPALDVGTTIDKQFGAATGGDQAQAADAFADGPPGSSQQDLNARANKYVAKRKAVFSEYAKKSTQQIQLRNKAFKDLVKKKKVQQQMAQRQANEKASKAAVNRRIANRKASQGAQMQRRKMHEGIDQANQKRQVANQQKVNVAKANDVQTKSTSDTQVKTTDVRQNVQNVDVKVQDTAAVADPARKPASAAV
jgi:hypothetical protein